MSLGEIWDFVLNAFSDAKHPVHLLGFVAQAVFFSRFLLQWMASEKEKRSVIPVGFWWCSLIGGLLMLWYAILLPAPPIVLAQLFGIAVYWRNLTFVYRKRRRDARKGVTPQD